MIVPILIASFTGLAAAFPLSSPADVGGLFPRASSGCSTSGATSCHNSSAVSDSCCFEYPGGLLMQTQFWDTDPVTGPSNSWTIHGLWPDHCDGTYDSSCDSSRAYTNMSAILNANGASSTLSTIQKYWVDINGDDETFWEHEWAKHGTCMSTFKKTCISSSTPGADATAYIQTVVKLFQSLPTYTWLSNAGITPDTSTTYSLSTLTSAIKASWGHLPALDCSSGRLNGASYYFNLIGSGIDGTFVPIDAPYAGSCPSSGITYYPKTSGTTTTTTGTTTVNPPPTGTGVPARATIDALQSGSKIGGLLSLGTWSTQTLATYTLSGTTSSFTMTSSKGNCGVSSGTFACGSGVSLTTFSAVTSGSQLLLASGGSTAWSSDGTPSGTTVYTVYTGSSHAQDYTLSIVGI
ncbi:ribonuclease T2 [Macrolepiota fuliginosa MF-IS2]|uniref:Ribonuclease T2-like n=1 Tax=Macrolepiota fuliginosa MF-IS2 TaxID=1400762 RepID=A0A9P5XMM6_9AGAR|nr:ribonuclease T2 [Macrolepiota fuliginosa MF-IS2]